MATRKIKMRGGQAIAKAAAAKAASTTAAKTTATPAKTAATPAKTAATPAKTAATPAKTAATPAKTAATPAKTAATPAKTAATPAKTAATPAKAAGTPAKAVGTPAKAVGTPAKTAATPAKAVGTPAKAAGTPAKPAAAVAKPSAAARPAAAASPALPAGVIEVTEDEYDGDVNPDYVNPLFDLKQGVFWAYFQMDDKYYKITGTPQDTERTLLDKIKKVKNSIHGATPSDTLRISLEQEKLDITARIPRLDKKIKELTRDLKHASPTDPNKKIYAGEIGVSQTELTEAKKRLVQITTAINLLAAGLAAKVSVGGRSRRNRRKGRSRRGTRRASNWW